MFRSRFRSFAVVAAAAACGSGTTPKGDAGLGPRDGSSESAPACKVPADVYVLSTIGPSATGACPTATVTNELMLGSLAAGVPSGTGTVHVDCTVAKGGTGFDLSAHVTSEAGDFSISGKMPPTASETGLNLEATLDYGFGGPKTHYSGTGCTGTLANASTPGYSPASGPPIAPGRIWATVTCPDMALSTGPGACAGTLMFRLENCRSPGCP